MTNFSRRQFIITAGAATAASLLAHGCSSTSSSKSDAKGSTGSSTGPAANAPKVETTKAKLGFIALTDSSPLIIAKEKGFFEKYGMKDVVLEKQKSWPVTRDNIKLGSASGGIDGAHILSPMPYLITLNDKVPMYLLARLNTNGQAISVANTYKDMKVGLDSKGLKQAVDKAKSANKQLKTAITLPGGTHDLWMRYWLAAAGIDPDKDVVNEPGMLNWSTKNWVTPPL